MKVRDWLTGGGAAFLLLAKQLVEVLSPYHLALYHRPLPSNTIAGALLLWLLLLWVLLALGIARLKRAASRGVLLLSALLLLAVLLGAMSAIPHVEDTRSQLYLTSRVATSVGFRNGLLALLMVVFLVMLVMSQEQLKGWLQRCWQGVGLVGFSLLWVVPQLAIQSIHPQVADEGSFHHPAVELRSVSEPTSGSGHRARIVWLLLDEASFQLAFEKLPAGYDLPNLKTLRSESFSYNRVRPFAEMTDIILPGLLLGKEVDAIRSDLSGRLSVHVPVEGWQSFEQERTLFAEARAHGWSTGVVGFFNPYCRILNHELDECSDHLLPPELAQMEPGKSVLENTVLPMERLILRAQRTLYSRSGGDAVSGASNFHRETVKAERNESLQMIRENRVQFMLLHIGLPHPPSIAGHVGAESQSSEYLENLLAADRLVGEVRQAIAQSGDDQQTVLMVTSDHSWRTWLWSATEDWSAGDESIRSLGDDDRPIFLLHLPGQSQRINVEKPVSELYEHMLLSRLIRNPRVNELELQEMNAHEPASTLVIKH
jgi:hypothetical protein